jgi:predicted nucleic acid-binding protein
VIFVDTSVWVASLRDKASSTAAALEELLDADDVVLPLPVRIELMAGVAARERTALRRALTALPVARPDDEIWARAESWLEQAAAAGDHFSVTDLLIAALAADAGALAWSLDRDFARMGALRFVQLYEPPLRSTVPAARPASRPRSKSPGR